MNAFWHKISFWIPTPNNPLKKDLQYSTISVLPIGMIVLSFFYNSPIEILLGLKKIIQANSLFATDYTYIASTGAALFNSGLLMLLNIYMLRKLDLKLNGMIISALFLIGGFAFVGKNIFNIIPFYIGGYLYAKARKLEFKNAMLTSMFSTSLAPIVSVITDTFAANPVASVILSYILGIFVGFVMPEIAAKMLAAHSGYNVYNAGFAAGFLAIVFNSILNIFGIPLQANNFVTLELDYYLASFLVFYFLFLIYVGFSHKPQFYPQYGKLLSYSGKLVTDFTRLLGFPISFINMGFMGLVCTAYIILMGGYFNGPTLAAMFTVVGFSSFGIHPRNTISIFIGVTLATHFLKVDLPITTIVITALFGSTLSPIVGEFGFAYGLVIGPLHLALVTNIGTLHAGLNLYNNGLSGGILAMVLVPILDSFDFKERR